MGNLVAACEPCNAKKDNHYISNLKMTLHGVGTFPLIDVTPM